MNMNFSKPLNIVVMSEVKLEQKNDKSVIREVILDKVDTEFTKILAQSLGFSYNFLASDDGERGRQLPDGNWTGMVGMLLRGEADLVISTLSVTEERSKILDFTFPFDRIQITFATRRPEYDPDPLVILKPFSWIVWMCIAVSFFLMISILYKGLSKRYSLQKIVLSTFSKLLLQNVGILLRSSGERLLILSWTVGATLLAHSYMAVILSFLTFPRLTGVRTISELADAIAKGKYECTTFPGTFIPGALAAASDPNAKIIGRSLLQKVGSDDFDEVLSNRKSSKKPAFVLGTNYLFALSTKYFISEDEFLPVLPAIAMRKEFCCKRDFERAVSYVWVSGIYQKLVKDAGLKKSLKRLLSTTGTVDRSAERSLSVVDIQGAFVILILGHTFGLIVFLLELLVHRTNGLCFLLSKSRVA